MEDAARAALPPPVAPLPPVTPEEGGEEAAEAAPDPSEPPKIEISDADLLQVQSPWPPVGISFCVSQLAMVMRCCNHADACCCIVAGAAGE